VAGITFSFSQSLLDMARLILALPLRQPRTHPDPTMETQLVIPPSHDPSTIAELLDALRKAHFKPSHESKVWGDWIHLYGCRSVISIECASGLCRAATIEHGEGEEDGEPVASVLRAFGSLGWHGVDENGEYPLDTAAGM